MGALGVQRVGRNDRVLDVQAIQQGSEQGNLIGLGAHLHLAQHHSMGMVERRQQVMAIPAIVPRPA